MPSKKSTPQTNPKAIHRLVEWFAATEPRLLRASGSSDKPGRRPLATLTLETSERLVATWSRCMLAEETARDIVSAAHFDGIIGGAGDHDYLLTAYGWFDAAPQGSCPFTITIAAG